MKHYDYIVVGAGAAGCVLAERLSQDRAASVLLLEVGGSSRSIWVDMPAALGQAISSGEFSTVYETQPEPQLGQRSIIQVQGRALGGSSVINGMMYIRGHRQDYDDWAAAGATGWSYDEVLPYFRRAERHDRRFDTFHGTEGLLGVTSPDPDRLTALQRAFVAAGARAGHGATDDFNGSKQTGFGYYDQTIRRGVRSSADRAFLATARNRSNLTVMTNCYVHSVLFDGEKATGVKVNGDGRGVTLSGSKVVLAAGAYATPAILLRSGVGAADTLKSLNITPVIDLPGVGRNLQNHPDINLQFCTHTKQSLRRYMRSPYKQIVGLKWLLTGRGVAASNHFEVGGFIKSSPALSRPDLQLTFFNLALKPDSMEPRELEAFQVHTTLVRPRSRGSVTIDAQGRPLIRLNYLCEPEDRLAFHSALDLLREVVAQPDLKPFVKSELTPGAAVNDAASIDEWLNTRMASFFHPAGTCRIGQPSDETAVVSPSLAVNGTRGLFVADASVMPTITAGNTYAPTLMVAEKGSDLIRAN